MRFVFRALLFLMPFLAIGGTCAPAFAQLNCLDFFHNPDGSWSPTHPIMMASNRGDNTIINPEMRFRAGRRSLPGLDLGAYLDVHCGQGLFRPQQIPRRP